MFWPLPRPPAETGVLLSPLSEGSASPCSHPEFLPGENNLRTHWDAPLGHLNTHRSFSSLLHIFFRCPIEFGMLPISGSKNFLILGNRSKRTIAAPSNPTSSHSGRYKAVEKPPLVSFGVIHPGLMATEGPLDPLSDQRPHQSTETSFLSLRLQQGLTFSLIHLLGLGTFTKIPCPPPHHIFICNRGGNLASLPASSLNLSHWPPLSSHALNNPPCCPSTLVALTQTPLSVIQSH